MDRARPYLILSTRPAAGEVRCQGRRCRRQIAAGEPVSLVIHEARYRDRPGALDAQAWLCADCVDRLGTRARRAPLPAPRTPRVGVCADSF